MKSAERKIVPCFDLGSESEIEENEANTPKSDRIRDVSIQTNKSTPQCLSFEPSQQRLLAEDDQPEIAVDCALPMEISPPRKHDLQDGHEDDDGRELLNGTIWGFENQFPSKRSNSHFANPVVISYLLTGSVSSDDSTESLMLQKLPETLRDALMPFQRQV
jgi:hypothetical protein